MLYLHACTKRTTHAYMCKCTMEIMPAGKTNACCSEMLQNNLITIYKRCFLSSECVAIHNLNGRSLSALAAYSHNRLIINVEMLSLDLLEIKFFCYINI